jgi:hypothetical protein
MKIYAVFANRRDGVAVSTAPCTSREAMDAVRRFREGGCEKISIYRNARSIGEGELKRYAEQEDQDSR